MRGTSLHTAAAFSLGATSIAFQSIVLRAFLAAYSGNELILGAVLSTWLALTGLGAFLGARPVFLRNSPGVLRMTVYLLAVLPPLTIALITASKAAAFPPGVTPGLAEAFLASLVLLAPMCMTTGVMFVALARASIGGSRGESVTRVYVRESIGSLAGGLVANLILIFLLTTFQTVAIMTAGNLALWHFLGSPRPARPGPIAATIFGGVLLFGMVTVHPERLLAALLYPEGDILLTEDTPFGNLTVTRQGEQVSVFENGVLLVSSGDPVAAEEAVHYAMAQRPGASSVLLVGGGITGAVAEVLKYPVKDVVCVELNPRLPEIGKRYVSLGTDRAVTFLTGDAWEVLRTRPERYDVVLVNLPDPVTLQLNRYYTLEFFSMLHGRLGRDAVLSFSLLPASDYLGTDARELTSIVVRTARAVFTNLIVIPGMRNVYLASDGPLRSDVTGLIERWNIPTVYVNKFYLDDGLLTRRAGHIMSALNPEGALNTVFNPVAYFVQNTYWLSSYSLRPWIIVLACVLLLASVTRKLTPVTSGMLAGGFAASSAEILLVVGFQVICGYLYAAIGLLVTAFMAGLALGARVGGGARRLHAPHGYARVQFILAGYMLVLPQAIFLLKDGEAPWWVVHGTFLLLTLAPAFLVGALFAFAAHLQVTETGDLAATLYGVDLVGAAAGALIVSAVLLPLIGIVGVSCVVAALVFLSGLIATTAGRPSTAISS